jgi:hypothetical protein
MNVEEIECINCGTYFSWKPLLLKIKGKNLAFCSSICTTTFEDKCVKE